MKKLGIYINFFIKAIFTMQAKCDKKALLIATNPTSICCVYKEKIVKNDSHR